LGSVSTSGLHLMLLSDIGQCQYRRKWIGRARKHCHSHWDQVDRFPSQSYIYFRYPSAILERFWIKEASGEVGIYTSEKLPPPPPKYIGIATEIVSISISVDQLLVLSVWDTVSISGLHLMLLSGVGHCWCRWQWIGSTLKHCHSHWRHFDIVFRRQVITTSGIPPPSWNFWMKESLGEVGIYTSENLPPPPPQRKHRYSHWVYLRPSISVSVD